MQIDARLLVPSDKREQGVFSFIARSNELRAILAARYGRDNLCLKVFKQKLEGQDPQALRWGKGVMLGQATRAQNVFAWHGLALRVIDIVTVAGDRAAQVTEYVEDDGREIDHEAVRALLHDGLRAQTHDMNPKNWIGGQQVDFQYYLLADDYPDRLRARAYEHTAWGSRSEPYQAVGALDLPGQRDQAHRAEVLRLDEVDWRGRRVLDIGCNLGALGRYLDERGLTRYAGVDLPHVADIAFEINNWLGYWNLDFVGASLPAEQDKLAGSYDAVFALSCQQCRPLPWAAALTDHLFYLEGHVPDREDTYQPQLEELFPHVDYLGMSRDHGPRPLFRCSL